MKFRVFGEKPIEEEEVFFRLVNTDDGGLRLETVGKDGSPGTYVLGITPEGIWIRSDGLNKIKRNAK